MHGDQDRSGGSEGCERQVAKLRRAIDDDDVIAVVDLDQRLASTCEEALALLRGLHRKRRLVFVFL